MSPPPAIVTSGLTKAYGRSLALDHLDLSIAAGDIVGYLGPNGAGKTTTVRLLLGLIRPTAGTCRIMGWDCHRQTVEAHRHLAYVPGEANLWPTLTGAETLDLLGSISGRVDSIYRAELVERFELDPTKKVRAYSRGNKQKLLLIAAFATRPDVLILDEPTTGLDPLMEQTFRHCLVEAKDRAQTVFLSSHLLSQVDATCDRVAILRSGRLVDFGALDDMRHLASVNVEMHFTEKVPDLADVPGFVAVSVDGLTVHGRVHGSMEPLLRLVGSSGVDEFISREPTLEEMFMAHYGPATDGPA